MNKQLPDGWSQATLGDIAKWGSGGTPSRANPNYYGGDIPWVKTGDLGPKILSIASEFITAEGLKNSSAKVFPNGSVAIAMYGATIGKTSILDIDASTNQACAVAIPLQGIDRVFTYYLLNNEKENFIKKGKGGAQPNISQEILKAHSIQLPPSNEQIRIADKLDSVLAKVDTAQARLEKIPTLLKRFRQSVLAAATSGELTREWREQNPFFEEKNPAHQVIKRIQNKKLAWINENNQHNEVSRVKKRVHSFLANGGIETTGLPNGWAWAKLEDVVLMVVDCHNKTAPYEDSGITLVRTTNIRDGRFIWEDLRFVSQDTYQYWSKRCLPEPGDVVFTREAPMGEAAVIPEGAKICLGQRTMLFRPIEDEFSAKFLLIALMDPCFRERSENIAVGTGVKHYRVGDVSELNIPVPPKEEQKEIVRRVESLFAQADVVEKQYLAAKQRLDRLTQSLLAKAFRGELVPQDPNDEPAAELLKRIQAERQAQAPAKRNRKQSA